MLSIGMPLCFLGVALFQAITTKLIDSLPGSAKSVEILGLAYQHRPSLRKDLVLAHLLLSRSYTLNQQSPPYSMVYSLPKDYDKCLLVNLVDAFSSSATACM